MTITKKQLRILMKENGKGTLSRAAMKANVTNKTAKKYLSKKEKIPMDGAPKDRNYKTRTSPFDQHWIEIKHMLENSPGLQANIVLKYLQKRYDGIYQDSQLRTLQRMIYKWRCEYDQVHKTAKFMQKYEPGRQSQSDWTWMDELKITIAGTFYKHMLFHCILSYSRFETISISHSESFDSLSRGYELAVLEMGGVCKEHRTDNLSAATKAFGSSRTFTAKWLDFTSHYGTIPTRNNPGVSHENGKIEKSHDLLKTAIDQELMLRGSRNFETLDEYEIFLNAIKDRRNFARREKFIEEQKCLKPLPEKAFNEATLLKVRVNPESLIQVLGVTYSVPTRLISNWLKAYVYRDKIDLFMLNQLILSLPRLTAGALINYRHIIDSLIRKPGAFEAYQHKEHLYPNVIFRQAYDVLKDADSGLASKHYCQLLYMAKMQGEQLVTAGIEVMLLKNITPKQDVVSNWIKESTGVTNQFPVDVDIPIPSLDVYDALLSNQEVL